MRRVNRAAGYAVIFPVVMLLASCGGGGGGGGNPSSTSTTTKSLGVITTMTPSASQVVGIDAKLTIGFTAALSATGWDERIELSDGNKTYPVTMTTSSGLLTIKPVSNLRPRTDYWLKVKAGGTATDGSVLKDDYVLKFRTVISAYEIKELTPRYRELQSDGHIKIADVNGDGRADLVEMSTFQKPDLASTRGYIINVYVQDTNKEFSKLQMLEVVINQSSFSTKFDNLIVLDIDGDKKPELIVPEYNYGDIWSGIRIFKIGPDGKFSENDFIVTNYTETLNAFDVDGDGRTDLVGTTNLSDSSHRKDAFQVMLGASTGFIPQVPVKVPYGARELGVADLDQDGKAELVFNGTLSDIISGPLISRLQIYSAGERGVFSLNTALTEEAIGFCPNDATFCQNMKIVDWRGDGKPVLVFNAKSTGPGSTQNLAIAFSRKPGGGLIKHFQTSTGYDNEVFAVRDMDGDGIADLLVVGVGQGAMAFSLIGGRADFSLEFSNMVALHTVFGHLYPPHVAVGEVDGDGQLDIVFDSLGASSINLARRMTY